MRTLLVTGGCGFIGSHFLRLVLDRHADVEVINLDLMTYAATLDNVRELEGNPRYRLVRGDICDAELVSTLLAGAWGVVNFAAETHVDRSLSDPQRFLRTNVLGVGTLLEAARAQRVQRFLQVSTDEVYGDVPLPRRSRESDALAPRSPYAAAKAGAEHLCHAYFTSYGLPALVTRGANTIGPRQYPEKAIPLFITNALLQQPLPLYGDGLQVRDWLDVEDHCRALDLVLHAGKPGEAYNVAAGNEIANLDMVRELLQLVGGPETLIQHVADRPGHDRRYALNTEKLQALGWSAEHDWRAALKRTVSWYLANPEWWQHARNGDYEAYYARQYRGLRRGLRTECG
jgi:dTDP-glucose 4,6-dehydratase